MFKNAGTGAATPPPENEPKKNSDGTVDAEFTD